MIGEKLQFDKYKSKTYIQCIQRNDIHYTDIIYI